MADVITHKCPNCDAGLTFNPKTQMFHCDYCLMDFTVQAVEVAEQKQAAFEKSMDALLNKDAEQTKQADAEQKSEAMEDFKHYSCPNCGAEVVTDETTAATFCYYCHNPVVISDRLDGSYLPQAIIPFQIDQEEAVKRFLSWIKTKKFIPKDFFSNNQIEKLTGVYFPFWDMQGNVHAQMGALGKNYDIWQNGDVQYTKSKDYQVERNGDFELKHVFKNALKKSKRELVEAVQPFDEKDIQAFSSGYLSGFQAQKRDTESSEFEPQILQEMKNDAEERLLSSITEYSNVTPQSIEFTEVQMDPKYTLLPVWVLTYRSKDMKNPEKDTPYYYAMNGQTGKIAGDLPVSKKRMMGLFFGIAIPLLLIFLIVGYFI